MLLTGSKPAVELTLEGVALPLLPPWLLCTPRLLDTPVVVVIPPTWLVLLPSVVVPPQNWVLFPPCPPRWPLPCPVRK